MTNKCRTCLVNHIYEGLGFVPTVKATYDVPLIPTREGSIDQEGELRWIERASD